MEQKHALGRRKSAVARVYAVPGKGSIVINGRELAEYFKEASLQYIVNQPFEVTGTAGQFDIKVTLVGGGTKGQAEAVSPVILVRLSVRNLVSLAHVVASSSASVNRTTELLDLLKSTVRLEIFGPHGRMGILRSCWKIAGTAENPGD